MLTNASFDPNQGLVLKDYTIIWEKAEVRMKITYDYLQDPHYVPFDPNRHTYQSGDYDKDKRLVIWRTLEKYMISTPEKTETLDKAQPLYISPNGDIEKYKGVHTAKNVYHAKSKVYDGEFKFFLLAAGLCFSDYLDANSMNLTKMPHIQYVEIKSGGNFGKDTKGSWELTVEPNSAFVKSASYKPEWLNYPQIKLSAFNFIKKGELGYAREGKIVFSDNSAKEYMDIDISLGDSPMLRQEINQRFVSPLPSGSEIIDFNEQKPTRTTIK
jgi:hypothetical protein